MAETMDFDLGSLAKYPNQNAIYRWITRRRPHLQLVSWPDHIRWEAAVFVSTPGISRDWIQHNLGPGWDGRFIQSLKDWYDCDMQDMGRLNANTATYDDCMRFIARHPKPKRYFMPRWMIPFFFDDIKNGMSQKEQIKVWGGRKPDLRRKGIIL